MRMSAARALSASALASRTASKNSLASEYPQAIPYLLTDEGTTLTPADSYVLLASSAR